jgi:hypothetical protein
MESSFYDFGYKLSGRLAEVQGFILALADDSGTTVTLDSEVADWWYIRDDKGALFRGTTASPHGVTQTTTLGYIRQ